jgi:predicted glutamine amidotransferase
MCRLYAHSAPSPSSSEDLLARAPFSLLRQSDVPGRRQSDGWGIGWYPGRSSTPRIVKSPGAAHREGARFRRAAAAARGRIVIGHIRAASNPRGLPKSRLIGMANTQPFRHRSLLFAHNGTVEIDSEAYFWQFVKHWERTGDPGRALLDCVRELKALWRDPKVRARHPGKRAPFRGLNTVCSDGRNLYALCLYPSASKALFSPRRPWGRMAAAARGGRAVVASEPADRGRWTGLWDAELRVIEPSGRTTRRRVRV